MPRERVVLTYEDQQAEFNRIYRRGFIYVGIGALFDIACAILIVAGMFIPGVAVGVAGILIGIYAGREFTRAGRAGQAMRERGA
jgi:hypothetical protein